VREKPIQGVFPILVTPFDEKLRIDVDSLQNLVEFQLQAGVHGLGIALGSEILRLTEAERSLVARTVVRQVNHRVPVAVNCGGEGTELAVHYSLAAQDDGVDVLLIMPPTQMPGGGAQIRGYFKSVSDATRLPIFIQDTSTSHVPADLIRQIAEDCEMVRYAKVESVPPPLMIREAVEKAGDLLTVFGGAAGHYFIEEMRRGSRGTMPGCSNPEAFVEVWNLYQSGDQQTAGEAFIRRILPINRLAAQGWGAFYHVHKEILRRRGVIRCASVRGPIDPLDAVTQGELQQAFEQLYPGPGNT
jgi:dihydrodipicolinate synthase/N-acetylneuraminate lyase